MKTPQELNTLSESLNYLKSEGFTEDFKIDNDGFIIKSGEKIKPEDLTIVRVFRFEGISDPDDMSVLYAIESSSGLKGTFIDAFGLYADQDGQKAAELLNKVNIIKDH